MFLEFNEVSTQTLYPTVYEPQPMLSQLVIRLALSCTLLLALPWLADELTNYFQIPHIFSGVAAIASCVGASLPLLGLIRNSD